MSRFFLSISRPTEFSGWVEKRDLEEYARNSPEFPIKNMTEALEQLERVGLVAKHPILVSNSIFDLKTVSGYKFSPTSLGMALLLNDEQPQMLRALY